MDKKILAYLNNETNVIKTDAIFSREKTDKGVEYIHVSFGDEERYTFWNNPLKEKSPPKSMGGKKPYVMLMVQKVTELQKKGIKNIEEIIGFLVLLSDNIEWNTGRIINKRSKKPLKYSDLQNKHSGGKYKFEKTMKLLSENSLLEHKPEGYFISTDLIKKGSKK